MLINPLLQFIVDFREAVHHNGSFAFRYVQGFVGCVAEKVIIIDWEYARLDDIFFDLASLCVEFKLSKKKQIYLLNLYFKNLEKEHLKKLALYKLIYKLLCKLWFKKEKVVQ